jgi:hypothetical protein
MAERIEIDFGVYEGSLQMPMSEHIGNGFEGIALLEHAGCEAMAKNMCPLVRDIDTCLQDMPGDHRGDREVTAKRSIGSTAGQKDLWISVVRARVTEIIE